MSPRSLVAALAAGAVIAAGGAAAVDEAGPQAFLPVAAACETDPADIRGGYYLSGNGDLTADAVAIDNLEGVTQYRSMGDPSVFPGWNRGWLNNLGPGVERNMVVEFKLYGAPNATQTVNGRVVPAPAMRIQKRPGTTFPRAYGYGQLLRGELDPLLDRMVGQLKLMPHRDTVNWQIASEFDTDHEFGTDEAGVTYTPAQSDARAVQAIHYLIRYLREHGLPGGVTFTIGMGGFDRASFKRMHPPSLAPYVDKLMWNAYNHGTARTAYQVFNRTRAWAMADLVPAWTAKAAIIAEWGTAPQLGDQPTWIRTVDEAIGQINSEPGIDITDLYYFNSNPTWATLSNPDKSSGLAALRAVYTSPLFADDTASEEAPCNWTRRNSA